jgi:hypothetical protein
MLYLNAYRVSQAYGGPEEGGWYYDIGEPFASIPIPTMDERGADYYINDGCVFRRECDACRGTGEHECDDDGCCPPEPSEPHRVRCQDCGELPADFLATNALIKQTQELLKDEAGRYEEISIRLERHFAQPFPERRPHYE